MQVGSQGAARYIMTVTLDPVPSLSRDPEPPHSLVTMSVFGNIQNLLLPAFSPSDWLNLDLPFGANVPPPSPDYFSLAWEDDTNNASSNSNLSADSTNVSAPSIKIGTQQPSQAATISQHGPSNFYPQPFYYNIASIANSLLVGQHQAQQEQSHQPRLQASNPNSSPSQSQGVSPSVGVIDPQIVRALSPIESSSTPVNPHLSHKLGQKRRASSFDSDLEHSHDEHDPEVPEGVESDGLIWGMNVQDYRALPARERKRVRNRISARTFRSKRKGEHRHLPDASVGL